ncbi:MAG: carbon-nitrogen hydrolase family protein [Candidatus Hydrogenedentes bacterium]|nr:carbon-nitrogen hydrolase family protein [Candidatus Hydrogenedentota bacterium]
MVLATSIAFTVGTALLGAQAAAAPPAEPARHRVRLALMRGVPVKWNLAANFDTFLALLDEAAPQKPDIFITPEGWLDGYAAPDKASTPERLRGVAQDLDESPYLQAVADQARERSIFVCFGFTSIEHGRIYNAAGLWGPDGRRIGVYRKTHLQRHDLQYTPGEGLPVWPTPWGPVGIMICADRRWPETARVLRLQGARLILNPTYGFSNELNEAMMRTRAYENQCFIAFTHPEVSLVTGPKGDIEAKEEGEEPGLLVCELDLAEARDDNHLRDRRPELYVLLTEDAARPPHEGETP